MLMLLTQLLLQDGLTLASGVAVNNMSHILHNELCSLQNKVAAIGPMNVVSMQNHLC